MELEAQMYGIHPSGRAQHAVALRAMLTSAVDALDTGQEARGALSFGNKLAVALRQCAYALHDLMTGAAGSGAFYSVRIAADLAAGIARADPDDLPSWPPASPGTTATLHGLIDLAAAGVAVGAPAQWEASKRAAAAQAVAQAARDLVTVAGSLGTDSPGAIAAIARAEQQLRETSQALGRRG